MPGPEAEQEKQGQSLQRLLQDIWHVPDRAGDAEEPEGEDSMFGKAQFPDVRLSEQELQIFTIQAEAEINKFVVKNDIGYDLVDRVD